MAYIPVQLIGHWFQVVFFISIFFYFTLKKTDFKKIIILTHFILFLSENDRPTSLAPDLIDYNMPLTATYLKQMKLQCMNTNERVSACCTRGQWVSSQQGSQGSTESSVGENNFK